MVYLPQNIAVRTFFICFQIIFIAITNSSAQQQIVHSININGSINPASADYIHEAILRAKNENAECLVISLNTPGGLLKSTRVIVSDFLNSSVPVIVYVSPSGSQAASAGVFITLAAHLSFMAPGTNIGAAHPVTTGEQKDSIMMEKITNDAAALIRTISEKRHKNVRWAEDAVRKSISITETEALKENVIDSVAANIAELLRILDSREVETIDGNKVLHTLHAKVIPFEKSFQQKLLDILSDPNIAYILMMLGFYGLLFELYNPGAIFPGVIGFICLILAFYSMHTLPINYAGLALILFAVILFLLEIKIISHGILTIGGVVSLGLGSVMLFQTSSLLDFIAISWEVIFITIIITVAFFVFAIGMGIKAQRKKPSTGIEGIVGEIGEAFNNLEPTGQVKVHGEIWNAVSTTGPITQGTKIKVESAENLILKVSKIVQ
ncbi:MAG: nodulation protein NfeD [Ignavibacteriales bacterium]|nr:nodulation protein NfeD [Ignavibacteriales bacterium]